MMVAETHWSRIPNFHFDQTSATFTFNLTLPNIRKVSIAASIEVSIVFLAVKYLSCAFRCIGYSSLALTFITFYCAAHIFSLAFFLFHLTLEGRHHKAQHDGNKQRCLRRYSSHEGRYPCRRNGSLGLLGREIIWLGRFRCISLRSFSRITRMGSESGLDHSERSRFW